MLSSNCNLHVKVQQCTKLKKKAKSEQFRKKKTYVIFLKNFAKKLYSIISFRADNALAAR